jgi:hypothetical protein
LEKAETNTAREKASLAETKSKLKEAEKHAKELERAVSGLTVVEATAGMDTRIYCDPPSS